MKIFTKIYEYLCYYVYIVLFKKDPLDYYFNEYYYGKEKDTRPKNWRNSLEHKYKRIDLHNKRLSQREKRYARSREKKSIQKIEAAC